MISSIISIPKEWPTFPHSIPFKTLFCCLSLSGFIHVWQAHKNSIWFCFQTSHITHFTNFTLFCTSPWILPNTESKQWLSLNPVVFWISNFSWILPKSCKKWKENIGRSGYFQNRLKKKCMNNLACTLSDSRNNILTCVKLKWNYGRRASGFIPNWDINNHIAS